jgi:hypothetical protein
MAFARAGQLGNGLHHEIKLRIVCGDVLASEFDHFPPMYKFPEEPAEHLSF